MPPGLFHRPHDGLQRYFVHIIVRLHISAQPQRRLNQSKITPSV